MRIQCKKILSMLLVFVLLLSYAPKTHAAPKPVFSTTYSSGAGSAKLFKVENGYERVEWMDSGRYLLIEKYNEKFKIVSAKKIKAATIMPKGCTTKKMKYGGVYEGKNYNFVVTGQQNPKQNDKLATIRVTKFDKKWKKKGACDLSNQKYGNNLLGIEVYDPFDFAVVEMEELDGNLWISTGREGYAAGDGLHHQGKLNIIIRQSDMKYLGSSGDFFHSFDQYLKVCNGKMYQLEDSEGSRGAYVSEQDPKEFVGGWTHNWFAGAGLDETGDRYKVKEVFAYFEMKRPGSSSYGTYASTGGFEASDSQGRLISVGNSVNQDNIKVTTKKVKKDDGSGETDTVSSCDASGLNKNIWIRSTTTDLKNTTGHLLTAYEDGGELNAGVPKIAKVNDNKFLVIWKVEGASFIPKYKYRADKDVLNYVYVDAKGQAISKTYMMYGFLSSVDPINDGKGNIVWYATNNSAPIFYKINTSGAYSASYSGIKKVGTKVTDADSGITYQVIHSSSITPAVAVVSYKKPKGLESYYDIWGWYHSSGSVKIPDMYYMDGVAYQVTTIKANAFRGQTEVQNVDIGENVTTIEKDAFLQCSKLRTVNIYSKSLKIVGQNAWKGISADATIYVPKSCISKYRKLMKNKYSGVMKSL